MFLHIDIDSFFASAERSRNSSLKNIAVAVGSRSNLEIFNKKRTNIRLLNDNSGAFVTPVFYSDVQKSFESYFVDHRDGQRKIRGIITTASYEARAYGVKTGMPIAQALQLCPHMVVAPPDYLLYHRLSSQIHKFVQSKIPQVEQFSIDEFFGDVRGWIEEKEVYDFALKLQMDIKSHFDIPVSIGIAKSKWIAKLATKSAKPYGVFEVKNIAEFTKDIPIKSFPGIGRGFQKRLESHYITTLGDICRAKGLFYSWKKPGIQLYHRIIGDDNESIAIKNEPKSIGISRTFDPIYDDFEVRRRVLILSRHIAHMVLALNVSPTLYHLKIRYQYGIRAKQNLRVDRLFSESLFRESLLQMYDDIYHSQGGAIKLSLHVSDFVPQNYRTLSLLELDNDRVQQNLSHSLQRLREKFGLDIIKSGAEL